MADAWQLGAALAGAYLLGSVPTGVLVGRLAGRDPRRAGSGNIWATNVTRTLGKTWGALTLIVDIAKGLGPAWVAYRLGGLGWGAGAGLAATVGHCFPVWLRFRGGKGVATAFGALAALAWPVAVLSALLWVVVAVLTRVPALGSLAAAGAWIALAVWDNRPFEVQLLAAGLAVLVAARHQSNLRVLKARKGPLRGRRHRSKL